VLFGFIYLVSFIQTLIIIILDIPSTISTTATAKSTVKLPFLEVGCFKDEEDRAISGQTTEHSGPELIQKCFERAKQLGNTHFGVQDSRECFTSSNAGDTYAKYGSTTGCRNGLGGVWKLSVYKINVEIENPSTKHLTTHTGSLVCL
jgi:hypothetical protein